MWECGECYILCNVTKHFEECPQTFRRMFVLFKEMRTQGQLKSSFSCFCVWCKSKEFGGKGSPRFLCVISVMKSFSLGLLRATISYWADWHVESCEKHPRWSSSAKKPTVLRILTEKNHRQIKLQYLQKVGIWTFGLLVYQINS